MTTIHQSNPSLSQRRWRRVASDERGITMILTLGVMVFTLLTLAALLTYTANSTTVVRKDTNNKAAYYAAQAGLQVFEFRLQQDPNYWATCPQGSANSPTALPGSAGNEYYYMTPLPASGTCSASSMVEGSSSKAAGTFRYMFTGCTTTPCPAPADPSSTQTGPGASTRSIVVSFKRESFLNFVYFTEYETFDPTAYPAEPQATSGSNSCYQYQSQRPNGCVLIQFQSGDTVSGPLHSNDQVVACGSPTFGRSGSSDTFEDNGTPDCPGGNSNPIYNGTKNFTGSQLTMPPNNTTLQQYAQAGTVTAAYAGPTDIVLLPGGMMTVRNANFHGGVTTTVPYPSNQVVYVSQGPGNCSDAYTPFGSVYDDLNSNTPSLSAWYDAADNGCPDVYVSSSGNYDTPLTIASAGDIVINGNLTGDTSSGSTALLGLIAQNFVRVFRPVKGRVAMGHGSGGTYQPYSYTSCSSPNSDGPGAMSNPTIDAAILSVTGSFVVDNYDCGNNEVDLNVTGAIAQVFRGPVGTTAGTGYDKNYVYDDRLAAQSPPHFLNPLEAGWEPFRSTICFWYSATNGCS